MISYQILKRAIQGEDGLIVKGDNGITLFEDMTVYYNDFLARQEIKKHLAYWGYNEQGRKVLA